VCSIDGATKKKTIDEVISCLFFLPVFTADTPVKQVVKEIVEKEVTPAKVARPDNPPKNLPAEPVKKTRRAHMEHLSTPSISGMLRGEQLPGVSEPGSPLSVGRENAPDQSFDAVQLATAWKSFAESVEAGQLKSALSVREPILLDNFSVEYNLDNEVQKQRIIQDLKPKLLAHLHRELRNELISIEFNVTENKDEILNKPYTEQEKFNTLALKFPALGILKQRFGLDFE
jgi:DNA polymerase-3 subunit gamma/tau